MKTDDGSLHVIPLDSPCSEENVLISTFFYLIYICGENIA
jgi:hypothetical protein